MRCGPLVSHQAVRALLHPQDPLPCPNPRLRGIVSMRHVHHRSHAAPAGLNKHSDKDVRSDDSKS